MATNEPHSQAYDAIPYTDCYAWLSLTRIQCKSFYRWANLKLLLAWYLRCIRFAISCVAFGSESLVWVCAEHARPIRPHHQHKSYAPLFGGESELFVCFIEDFTICCTQHEKCFLILIITHNLTECEWANNGSGPTSSPKCLLFVYIAECRPEKLFNRCA